jgi:retron-type reverse transcriptase
MESGMKRHGNLFEAIVSWPNLIRAAHLAGSGKPLTRERAAFEFNRENELAALKAELETGVYVPGPYRSFTIFDPKQRLISAAPYRDRVVHHALCAVIEPLLDRGFLPQNHANRRGRGLHKAVRSGRRITNASPFLLKADIQKYFPSIDHQILKDKIARRIKCRRTLALIDTIIDHGNPQEPVMAYFPGDDLFTPLERRKGLPIGNLTSQLFANLYLDRLDHFIVQGLKLKAYVRYVDDFLIGSTTKEALIEARAAITAQLAGERLKLHGRKTVIFPARRGLTFLGFRLYPGRVLAGKRCGKRFAGRLKQLQQDYAEGLVGFKQIKQVIASYNGHLAHAATEKLRASILAKAVFTRSARPPLCPAPDPRHPMAGT